MTAPFAPPTDQQLRPAAEARRRIDRLIDRHKERQRRSVKLAGEFDELNAYLAIAGDVTLALEQLNQQLFQQLLAVVETNLTVALQEILEQPLRLTAKTEFKRDMAAVEFCIERNGEEEDILRGQGGSVQNILSVGLRMFALTTLDETQHRRFLVLDEQDCWLRPDLVPKLVKMVHDAGQALGFQVIMISHHDVAVFERYADKIYQFVPVGDGAVQVREIGASAAALDAN
jgi:ABC-type glutathione transport system ATPase component